MKLTYEVEIDFPGCIKVIENRLWIDKGEIFQWGHDMRCCAHDHPITCVATSPSRRFIGSVDQQGNVKIWRCVEQHRMREAWQATSARCPEVVCLLIDESDQHFVAATLKREILFYKTEGGPLLKPVTMIPLISGVGRPKQVLSMQYLSPNHILISDGRSETLLIKEQDGWKEAF